MMGKQKRVRGASVEVSGNCNGKKLEKEDLRRGVGLWEREERVSAS